MQADEGSVMDQSVIYFGQLLEERSGGKLKLDIYTTGQLGTIPEVQAGIKAGDIDMGNYSLDAGYADAYDDFKNWTIRVQENAIQMKLWSCLGAKPTPLAMGETYIALQQGLVNAFDNISDAHVLTKMYEQEKYIVHTNHIVFNNAMFMNLDTFNSLPQAYQDLLLSCQDEVVKHELELNSVGVQANIDFMVSQGLVDVQLSDELRQEMYQAVQPVIEDIRAQAGDAIVDAALKGMGIE